MMAKPCWIRLDWLDFQAPIPNFGSPRAFHSLVRQFYLLQFEVICIGLFMHYCTEVQNLSSFRSNRLKVLTVADVRVLLLESPRTRNPVANRKEAREPVGVAQGNDPSAASQALAVKSTRVYKASHANTPNLPTRGLPL